MPKTSFFDAMITDRTKLFEIVKDAVSKLVSVRLDGETTRISLPIAYPSGAFAGVSVSMSGDRCFVSDCAIGLREAEMMVASSFYDASAREAAEWFGVGYDGASVFAASAPIDRVDGAIVSVANASVSAVASAIKKADQARAKSENSAVFDIIADIFGVRNVSKMEEIGGKDAIWPAHNVVSIKDRKSIFEFVGQHPNSIANKFMMFSDIAKIEKPPALISVVKSIDALGPKGSMLQDVSSVISIKSERRTFLRFAAA